MIGMVSGGGRPEDTLSALIKLLAEPKTAAKRIAELDAARAAADEAQAELQLARADLATREAKVDAREAALAARAAQLEEREREHGTALEIRRQAEALKQRVIAAAA